MLGFWSLNSVYRFHERFKVLRLRKDGASTLGLGLRLLRDVIMIRLVV